MTKLWTIAGAELITQIDQGERKRNFPMKARLNESGGAALGKMQKVEQNEVILHENLPLQLTAFIPRIFNAVVTSSSRSRTRKRNLLQLKYYLAGLQISTIRWEVYMIQRTDVSQPKRKNSNERKRPLLNAYRHINKVTEGIWPRPNKNEKGKDAISSASCTHTPVSHTFPSTS